ncbi:MAG TPA: hypothetical protein VKV20_19500 [Ktedonobacteraceae bacterium]|jgi:heme A synthase|nr:hypothetical protein [Ktedonobacteraceae bacterium]
MRIDTPQALAALELRMVDIIANLHFLNMVLVLATGAVSAIWGFILFFMKRPMNRPWRIMLIITGIDTAIQALLGITLVLLGQKPGAPGDSLYYLHYVYGAIVVLAIPVAVTYATGGKEKRRDVLIFSIAALILVAAAIRALMTGPA